MSISKNDNTYKTLPKQEWREWIYSNLTPDAQSCLTSKDGKLLHKWLEPVGENATTFDQLLKTGRIDESQLIGIDINQDNIKKCQELYPRAEFHCTPWVDFCSNYHSNDIGVIVFDLFYSGYGEVFQNDMKETLLLAKRCLQNTNELLLVVNVDGDKTYRGSSYNKNISPEETFKETLEYNISKYLDNKYKVDTNAMYKYKQSTRSTEMLSCALLL